MDIQKIRSDFPMLDPSKRMQNHPLVYLDNAATTFKPRCVVEAMDDYYNNFCANAHRGDYDLAHMVDTCYEEARKTLAKFINARPEEVVFTSGASMSLNLVAYGYGMKFLTSNDEVLLTQAEHASNVLPWFKVAETIGCHIGYIPLDEEGRLTIENVEKSITEHTKIISIAQVTNVLGFHVDIKAICKVAHEHNIIVIVDGAQSVPHQVTNVKDMDCDFLAFSGHKMCGPTGTGVLYGKYELLQKMDPLMSGGGMNARFDMCGEVSYLLPPQKFEAGTQNIAGALGLAKAVEYLTAIGMENIEAYEKELRAYAIQRLEEVEGITIYNRNAESGIITFNLKDVFAQDAATYFNSKGVCVRSGQHCAKILMDFLKCHATVRASIYFYNTKEEIDALVEACKTGGDFLDAYFN